MKSRVGAGHIPGLMAWGFLCALLLATCGGDGGGGGNGGGGGDGGGGGGIAIPITGNWGAATLIETGAGEAVFPRISMDGSGNAIAVWTQLTGTRWRIYANRFVRGTGWETETLIETGAGEAGAPQVAMDGNGNAVALWHRRDGGVFNIYANRYVPGEGWGTETLIDTAEGDAYLPQVAMDDGGNAVVVWQQRDGTIWSIYANRYVPGAGWGTATLIEAGEGDAYSPRVGMDGGGNAIAVWWQRDGAAWNVFANRYVPGTGWGTGSPIKTGSEDAWDVHVAVDELGNAVAVWQQWDGMIWSVFANRYVVGSGWGTETIIENGPGDVDLVDVAVDKLGNAVAVWTQKTGTDWQVHTNLYIPGTGWGSTIPLGAGSGSSGAPHVAFDRMGNAVAVWEQWDGMDWSVLANRYVPGTGWGTARSIGTGHGMAMGPQVAMDGGGNAVVVWWEFDGASRNVFANRYEVQGG